MGRSSVRSAYGGAPDPNSRKGDKADAVQPGLTYWMRPPQGQNMDDGTQMGEDGYIDPHAGAMEEWEDIDKGASGGFRPDGSVKLHSQKKYGQAKGVMAKDGSAPKSGSLRRTVKAQRKSLITGVQ